MFSPRPIYSHQNGRIVIKRGWWRPEIEVDGYVQSGTYMKLLWRSALKQLEKDFQAPNILMLGLGAGSAIREVHSRFPKSQVTALEWDEAMIDLARRSRLYPAKLSPKIIIGDAIVTLQQLNKQYDLVLIDLFKGNIPEPRLGSAETIAALIKATSPSGRILLNAFEDLRLIESIARHLDYVQYWKFRINHLAMYRLFGTSQSGDIN